MSTNTQLHTLDINEERIIGIHEGDTDGPMVIAFGGIHGNEPAGILAMQELLAMIENEPNINPSFAFAGTLIGLRGNMQAIKLKKRYIKGDLNRRFTDQRVQRVLKAKKEILEAEDLEIREIIDAVKYFIQKYQPKKLIILDLHTTSSQGGIFSITSEDPESERIATGLYAPVVRGILAGIKGTTIHFFKTDNLGVDTTTVVFESGQHDNPLSVKYAISGIINCLRSVGCVQPVDVEAKHDNMLRDRCKGFPKITEIIYTHHIQPTDNFEMHPGYISFQSIQQGEILAKDKNGKVPSPFDGMILMPLYQKQGEDGFFIVKKIR